MSEEIDPDIQVGDIVALNSGGPSMSVVDISLYDERACCRWFGDGDWAQEEWFPKECLRLVDGILVNEDGE